MSRLAVQRSRMWVALALVVSAALAVMSAQAGGAAKSGGLLADEAAGALQAPSAQGPAGPGQAMAELAAPSDRRGE